MSYAEHSIGSNTLKASLYHRFYPFCTHMQIYKILYIVTKYYLIIRPLRVPPTELQRAPVTEARVFTWPVRRR